MWCAGGPARSGESGSAKLAIPPATGIRKPSMPVRAWAARLASAGSW